MASKKWGKRYFENQTIYTPPHKGLEYIVASGGPRLRIYWARPGSVSLNILGSADSMKQAFSEIRKFDAKLGIVGSW